MEQREDGKDKKMGRTGSAIELGRTRRLEGQKDGRWEDR